MSRPEPGTKGIKSAETVFDILELIAEQDHTTVTEIAERLEYSKSTIFYYLRTMQERRYITRENGDYRLGLRMASLGAKARRQYDPWSFVQERTDDLAREVGAGAEVVVEEAGKGVVLHRSRTEDDRVVETYLGMEFDLPETAFGKAILAFLPAEQREEILTQQIPPEGDDSTVDREDLRRELDEIKQVGLAYAEDGYATGACSIAAPIVRASSGEVYGAVGIWGRPDRITDPTRYAKARRFAGDTPEEVEKMARIIGDKM